MEEFAAGVVRCLRAECEDQGDAVLALSRLWGFPWGLILTPVQIIRNLWGLAAAPASFKPSAQLEKLVRLSFAEELQRAQPASAVPPPLTEAGR